MESLLLLFFSYLWQYFLFLALWPVLESIRSGIEFSPPVCFSFDVLVMRH